MAGRIRRAIRAFQKPDDTDHKGRPRSVTVESITDPLREFTRAMDTVKEKKLNYGIYKKGGEFANGVDAYVDFVVSDEPKIRADEEKDQEKLQAWWDKFDGTGFLKSGVRWSLVFGNSNFEIVKNVGGDIVRPKYIDARTTNIKVDKSGEYNGVVQTVPKTPANKRGWIKFTADESLNVVIIPDADEVHGISIYTRNVDNIKRKIIIDESTTQAIIRHGYPKYHIIQSPVEEGVAVPEEVFDQLEREFEDINAQNEFITDNKVEIKNIDDGAKVKALEFGEWSMMNLVSGFGLPEEFFGLGRGSTEATAKEKRRIFEVRTKSIRKTLTGQLNNQLFDKLREQLGLTKDGKLWIEFPDINPETEADKAAWISSLMPQGDPFSVFTVDEIRDIMGFGPMPEEEEPEEIPEDGTTEIPPGLEDILIIGPDGEIMETPLFKSKSKMLQAATTTRPDDERTELTQKFQIPGLVTQEGKLVTSLNAILLAIEEDLDKRVTDIISKKDMAVVPPDMDVMGAILKLDIATKHKTAIIKAINVSNKASWDASVTATLELIGSGAMKIADTAALEWVAIQGPLIQGRITGSIMPSLKFEISQGLQNGESINQITNRMSKTFEGTRAEMERIARTETQRAANEGRLSTYEQNSITKVEFLVTDDDKTCAECLSFDGKIMTIDEARALIPVHPNCRCTWMPVVS